VLVTHDERVAAHCKRVVRLSDGQIISDELNHNQLDAWAELAKYDQPAREVAD
jgi:ABC-type sulfate/molybdate transport systems ATPase subunit